MIKLIAAISKNGVIGKDGDLIFNDPEDVRIFRNFTIGHSIYMGRKTWESLGSRPLKDRDNYVFTRGEISKEDWANPYIDLNTFIEVNKNIDKDDPRRKFEKHQFIIGGGEIYNQTIGIADELVISQFHKEAEGDTYFPEIDYNVWICKYITRFTNFDLKTYKRRYESY